jgi:16S rRNA (guanine527-N7)-methyltransferase
LSGPAGTGPSELDPRARARLERVLELLAVDATAPSSITDPARAWKVHVADSLSGLDFPELERAEALADVGSGAGSPGIVLAVAKPHSRIDLIESVRRKCDFMRRALEMAEISNARVVCERAEAWAAGEGREVYDAVTARAVGRLATLAELASPLLKEGGTLVAWKGRRDPEEEAELERACPRLAMTPVTVRWVGPFAGSRHRHLWLMRKSGPTPPGLPRRAGMAKKRPRGSQRGR